MWSQQETTNLSRNLKSGTRLSISAYRRTYCQRHPDVETGLRCCRCKVFICSQCLQRADDGYVCPACAVLGNGSQLGTIVAVCNTILLLCVLIFALTHFLPRRQAP